MPTLRHYDELGLLKPAQVDKFTDYRYYTVEQLPRLNRILALKDLGLSLDQIKQLLKADVPPAQLRGMLTMKRADIERQLEQEQARLSRVEARLRQIEDENTPPKKVAANYPSHPRVRVHELPGVQTMATTIHHGSLFDIPRSIIALFGWLGTNGYRSAGPIRELHLFGREVDLPDDEEDLRVRPVVLEMQVPVERE